MPFVNLETIEFIPGLELSRRYYDEAVQPILNEHFPGLPYAAARLDGGSDVLGFDTPLSRDHGWGPRLNIYLGQADLERYRHKVLEILSLHLPPEFYGYPTNFESHEDGSLGMVPISEGPVKPYISVYSVPEFFLNYLGHDVHEPLRPTTWLTLAEQRLRTIRSGLIFRDDTGELTAIRDALDYYPHDLWLYLMAVAWRRLDQEQPFVGRTGDIGDELGSQLITARQIVNTIRLCFLMEREYAPYSKWLGRAFSELKTAAQLTPLFRQALSAETWQQRQELMAAVYEKLARLHNGLEVTPALPEAVSLFHNRPYLVIQADRFTDALLAAVSDPEVKALPAHLGGIDQFVDSTDVLSYPERSRLFGELISNLSQAG